MKRILTNELSKKIDQTVLLQGWVATRRDHGKIIFIDLRDRKGIAQVVFVPNGHTYKSAETLRPEWVIEIAGRVKKRPKGMENKKILSGDVEIQAEKLTVLAEAKTPPFDIDQTKKVDEAMRMKYRYLDLRSPRMKQNIINRHKVIQFVREYLTGQEFIEVETPILTKSTPEGARDYVVPSRLQPCHFYALPQSPQQYKQLLMVAGFERYFQIARAFRDEDTRGDRQPEFTQIDIEMAFTNQEEIMALVEKMLIELVKRLYPYKKITIAPFPKIPYEKAVKLYKSDRPDLRKNKNNPEELAFAWITDFPMFAKREDGSIGAAHHPFTKPQSDDLNIKTKAFQYDLVCNGLEIGGGSIRTSNAKLLEKVFEFMGHKKQEIQEQFGHLLEAFEYGVPPHGGIAPGLDRIMAILQNEPNIREVIAFPKTGDGRDLMMNSPSILDLKQLKELAIKCQDSR